MEEPSVNDMQMAQNADFLNRVQYAMVKAAKDKLNDNPVDPGTLQKNFASKVLADPSTYASPCAVLLVTDIGLTGTWSTGTSTSSATDGIMYSAAFGFWDEWAR